MFTSISLNYLPKARILATSVKRFHPEWKFHLLISDLMTDEISKEIDFRKELFDRIVWVHELDIPNVYGWIFKHSIVEMCTAVKGIFLQQLINEGVKKVIYLDPDIVVFNRLDPLIDLLDEYAILLTPHLLDYSDVSRSIFHNEIAGTLRHGIFNLGFFAVNSDKNDGKRFAHWWRNRLLDYCYVDYEMGLFTDQKWCNLVPSYFEDHYIVRDPGCNVASWNLDKRKLSISRDGQILVNNKFPLRFYHFTGYDSGAGNAMTQLYSQGNPIVNEIWLMYQRMLMQNGQKILGNVKNYYSFYENGKAITMDARKIYRRRKVLQDAFPNPYSCHFYRIIPMDVKTRPSAIADKISVIIPVKNGGEQLRGLLKRLRSQRKVQDVEIIAIDSESTDNSVDIATEYGANVIKIPQKEFNHGATRNLGAKEASSDFLVFTVQDAMPINDYWLYNMLCPFLEYPELAALSSKQFVKPEADLFSLWMGESLMKSFGLEGDTIYSLSDISNDISLEFFDSVTKRRLTFFDNVSSCVRKSVFKEIQFAPLINAEDIDYGVKLIERKKTLGYLTSTGVYHWHERGSDYVFKRHYIGTKANVYTLKNELQYFYDINNIGWEALSANIAGLYDLISIAVAELEKIILDPLGTIRSFMGALHKNIETTPYSIEKRLREKDFYGEKGLSVLLKEIVDNTSIAPEQKYNLKHNFLISDFMKRFENFAEYICSKHYTLEGRERDFISCLYKIYAAVAGEALGAYILEAETLNRLTPELKRIDYLLGKGVCY